MRSMAGFWQRFGSGIKTMKKHAIVMGGGMGIGEAIARKLHADGWALTVVDRIAAKADFVANELGENAHAECADITLRWSAVRPRLVSVKPISKSDWR